MGCLLQKCYLVKILTVTQNKSRSGKDLLTIGRHNEFMSMNFNENSEKSRFTFKPNPINPAAYQILENKIGRDGYEPVGDYVVLDQDEESGLTEKKLINLVGLMNGHEAVIDLSTDVDSRLLYHVVPKKMDSDQTKIIFRTYNGRGISKENAMLEIERGIFDA